MSSTREDLHELVDRLREEDTEDARRLLELLFQLRAGREGPEGRDLQELLEQTDPAFEGLAGFSERVRAQSGRPGRA